MVTEDQPRASDPGRWTRLVEARRRAAALASERTALVEVEEGLGADEAALSARLAAMQREAAGMQRRVDDAARRLGDIESETASTIEEAVALRLQTESIEHRLRRLRRHTAALAAALTATRREGSAVRRSFRQALGSVLRMSHRLDEADQPKVR